jgi:ribosomal protein L11 methyltransferase
VSASNEAVEAVSEILSRFGHGGGVAVEQPLDRDPNATYVVKAYLPCVPGAAAQVRRVRGALGRLRAFGLARFGGVETQVLEEEDWLHSWRAHYRPTVVGRYLIKPTWVEADSSDRLVVEIDPGMAFGTGLHPTTRQMLEAMSTIALTARSVLDVGTGSGILAMAARAAGATPVVAVDTDRLAVETAQANVARAFPDIEVRQGSAADVAGAFELVLANITAGALTRIAPHLRARTLDRGMCLLAGIIASGEPEVRAAVTAAGFAVAARDVRDDWIALILRVA